VPPTWEEAQSDPGYQFALQEGLGGLQRNQAAAGVLRTSGSLKDLIDYGREAAASQYQNVWDRAAAKYGINRATSQDVFAPKYGSWQTAYGGDLSKWTTRYGGDLSRWTTKYGGNLNKYLQRQGNLFSLLNQPPPQYPGYY
jgi:hypothetical protein